MSTTLSALKKSRGDHLSKLTAAAASLNEAGKESSSKDDRYWTPTVDKAGNGSAVIRFLPAPQGEDIPWIRFWDHGFKGPGGWYIEKSLTSLGANDPVSEMNSSLWNTNNDPNCPLKKLVRERKRRLHYVSNILVVNDPMNPENNGKIFLFMYGKKIFDKINSLMNPSFDDESPQNPFDFWDGSNFKMKIKKVEGYRNFDDSKFDRPSAIADSDAEIESIWKRQYALQPLIAADQFKSYAELKDRLDKVLGISHQAGIGAESNFPSAPYQNAKMAEQKSSPKISDANDDETEDFFRSLAEDD